MGADVEWQLTTLGQLGKWLSGGTPSKANKLFWSGTIPWVSPKDMKVARIGDSIDQVSDSAIGNGTKLAPEGAILVVVRGMILAHTFPIALTTRSLAFNQDIKALVCDTHVRPDFLLYWLQNQAPKVLAVVNEATHGTKRVPTDALHGLTLLLPPLPEQRKIAAILSSVDEAIEKTQAVIDQVQVVKKGLMQQLLTRGLPGRHTRFKQTEIGEVPEDWAVLPLTELGNSKEVLRTGPFGSSLKSRDFTSAGTPVLTIKSLGVGEIVENGLFYVGAAKAKQLAAYTVREGDLVFSRVADVGRSAVIPRDATGWIVSSNLMRIRTDPNTVDPRYLMYCIAGCTAVTRQIEVLTNNAGRQVVSSPVLKKLLFPVPCLEEQRAIAGGLAEIEERSRQNQRFRTAMESLKLSLMSILLSGQLRVSVEEDAA